MQIMLILLILLVILLIGYLWLIKRQLRRIRETLDKRCRESTQELLTFELINKEFTRLGKSINNCLKAEETLRLKVVQEENSFKEMIANISHDLRTPLTAIKGYQQLLLKTELDELQKQELMVAMKHTEELGELIEHFFEYAYVVNYKPKKKIERLNLVSLVTDCLLALVTQLEERGLSIQYEERSPVYIEADREMINRILENLMRNCIKYSVSDIAVEVVGKETCCMVCFRNQVSPENHIEVDKLFDRFYTGDPARRTSNGLGLSIVKALTEELDGKVYARLDGDILSVFLELQL